MPKPPVCIGSVHRPYPDNWPWSDPHRHPEDDCKPFEGFDPQEPHEGTSISNIARHVREAKMAFNSLTSVPALFATDVEDGDIVIPLPCKCDDDAACNELMETLAKIGKLPDAIWVPALRETTDSQISTLAAVDVTTYDPPFYGVAYKRFGRVMVGPVVVHPRFKFHTGDKIYADKNGDLTTTANDTMVGVCLAPGAVYLSQYASVLKEALTDLYDNAISDTITKVEQEGLDGDNIGVTTDGAITERPLEVRFGDWVNVKDFGAKGDGKTNDTAAFNAAIAHAQELGSNVCLFIPVGDYLVTTLPTVPCYGPGSVKFGSYTYSPFELLFRINGAIQKDENGRYKVDFSKMSKADLAALIKQLLPTTGGGLTTDEDGKLVLDLSLMTEEQIRQLIEDMLPETGGGLTTDEDGKLVVDFSQMPKDELEELIKSLLPTTGGNLETDDDGKLVVKVEELIQDGGGLSIDDDGKIYVDFDSMPTDKFETMLKSIRVPIWITSTKYFYVNSVTGSDTVVSGIGESQDKPFKTIKACANYVTENYNINSRAVGILLADGTYNENNIRLGEFSRSTGSIVIRPIDEDSYGVIINDDSGSANATFIISGGNWYLRGLDIDKVISAYNDGIAHFVSVISGDAGVLELEGCDISFSYTGEAPTSGSVYMREIAAYDSAEIVIAATSKSRNKIVGDMGNNSNLNVVFAERGGKIKFTGSNTSQARCTIQSYGTFSAFAFCSNAIITIVGGTQYNPKFEVPLEQTATGKRYGVINRGYIGTGSAGPTFFPGSTDGTVEESSYSVYI